MPELRPGQNVAWPDRRVTVYVERASAAALVVDANYRARGNQDLIHAAAATGAGGTAWLPGPPEGITVDLDALTADGAAHVLVMAVGAGLAAAPPTGHLLDTGGDVLATMTPDGLARETAVVLVELYRHREQWKVRAVGRGFDAGLAAAAAAHGLTGVAATSPGVPTSAPAAASAPQPAAGQATQTTQTEDEPDEARMLQLVGMILDDASRTTASRRSSVRFAEQRLEGEIEQVVSDPAMRIGPAGDQARAAAAARRDELVRQADESHARDVAQLVAELQDLEQKFPPSMARWQSPGWAGFDPAGAPSYAIRAGELTLDEALDFRLPMMLRLPFSRQLWIDPEQGGDQAATQVMSVLALRAACAMAPVGAKVRLIDIGGRRGTLGFPERLLAGPPVTDPGEAGQVLRAAVDRNEIVQVALEAGATDSLSAEQAAPWIVLCPDLPTGLDESSLQAIHRLCTQQAGMGVQLLLSGSVPGALGVPLLESIFEQCLRLPSGPGGDLVDAFGGIEWVFVPDLGPPADVAADVLARFAVDPARPERS